MDTRKIINGTWGECWLDSDKVAECFGLNAKIEYQKEEIKICGRMGTDTKIVGMKGKGSVKLHKVNSRMAKVLKDVRVGNDLRFTIITKLDDPDGMGAERVSLNGVSFDDLTLADWEAGKAGTVEVPFTFVDYEFLDEIDY